MQFNSQYIIITEDMRGGIAFGVTPHLSILDAAWKAKDAQRWAVEVTVCRMDRQQGTKAPMLTDVTEEAFEALTRHANAMPLDTSIGASGYAELRERGE